MKTLFFAILLSLTLSPFASRAEAQEQDKTAGEKAADAWDKTKQKTKEAGRAVVDATMKAANAVTETVNPDADARHVNVTLTGSRIEMPKSVKAGKTAFVVKNAAKEDQNFEVVGEGIDRGFVFDIAPGQTKTLQVDLRRGRYQATAIRKNGKEQRFEVNLTAR